LNRGQYAQKRIRLARYPPKGGCRMRGKRLGDLKAQNSTAKTKRAQGDLGHGVTPKGAINTHDRGTGPKSRRAVAYARGNLFNLMWGNARSWEGGRCSSVLGGDALEKNLKDVFLDIFTTAHRHPEGGGHGGKSSS